MAVRSYNKNIDGLPMEQKLIIFTCFKLELCLPNEVVS